MNDQTPTCPKCGTVMKPLTLDGSVKSDGNLQLDGFYCPNCKEPATDETSIGTLKIVKMKSGYCFMFGDDETAWTGHSDPRAVADDVYCHATGCYDWDSSDILGPTDLSEWEKC